MTVLKKYLRNLGIYEGLNALRIGPILMCGDFDNSCAFIMSGKLKNNRIQ